MPEIKQIPLKDLHCYSALRNDAVNRSFGTLGGGNHFIEIDRSMDGDFYLVIHSGSRRLGKDIAMFYQKAAFFIMHGILPEEAFKKRLRISDVNSRVRMSDCFLMGEYKNRYLDDMRIAVKYAELSRKYIGEVLIDKLHLEVKDSFTSIHNYIDVENGILRKGAVSAQKEETLIIPINMRDGSLICKGKGNADWNYTAPHGAGRLMKRSEAKANITLDEFKKAMEGVYSTSVGESTIDESPMAYRSIDDIVDAIEPTVDIVDIATPMYNFKASKNSVDDEIPVAEE